MGVPFNGSQAVPGGISRLAISIWNPAEMAANYETAVL
jgi:hypothetical protein